MQPCGAEEVVMARAYRHERWEETWRDCRGMQSGGILTMPVQPCDSEEAVMGQAGGDCAMVHHFNRRGYSWLHH